MCECLLEAYELEAYKKDECEKVETQDRPDTLEPEICTAPEEE